MQGKGKTNIGLRFGCIVYSFMRAIRFMIKLWSQLSYLYRVVQVEPASFLVAMHVGVLLHRMALVSLVANVLNFLKESKISVPQFDFLYSIYFG